MTVAILVVLIFMLFFTIALTGGVNRTNEMNKEMVEKLSRIVQEIEFERITRGK